MRLLGFPSIVLCGVLAGMVGRWMPPVSAQPGDAAAVMAAARTAIGGDAKIGAVKTFIANGRTRQVRGENLVPIEFEIQAELPDKYARRDEFPAQDAGPTTSGFNGEALILIPRPAPPPPRAGAPPPSPDQQEAALRGRLNTAKQDFARLMLGMFASSYSGFPLTFTYLAQAEAPQGKADVIEVKGPGNFTGRFFINSQTHFPIMLSWQAQQGPPGGRGPATGAPPPAPGAPGGAAPVEQRMFFADYRNVDGLQLPFRIRRAAGAETTEETTFDRFRINAKLDPRRFETR
jgi:hypothetical protein